MQDFGADTINGQTFEIAVNEALATTYKVNGKRCSAAKFWQARRIAEAA